MKNLLEKKRIAANKLLLFFQKEQPLYDDLQKLMFMKTFKYSIEPASSGREKQSDSLELLLRRECEGFDGQVTAFFDDALPFCKLAIMEEVFTRLCHHLRCNVIATVQNLFDPSLRVISRNSHYLILFRNPRDSAQLRHLAYQIYPSKERARALITTVKSITAEPYSAVMLDFKPDTPDQERVKSRICDDDVYVHCFEDELNQC